MSRQRPTKDKGGGYPYDDTGYDDGGYQYPHPQQGYSQQHYPQHQQYTQQTPIQQHSYQESRITPTPQQQFSTSPDSYPIKDSSSFVGENRSNESHADDESIGQSHIDKDGWLFRPPENGHVITKGQIANRVIQYYEMFLVNVFLLGFNVVRHAKLGVDGSTIKNFLFDACGDRFIIEQFDYCAASRLSWGLIGGAIIYFVFTSLVALALSIELRRKGYHSTFTALWHSPAFLLCFFYPEAERVDILSIPNKYVELSLWTRSHIHRISLAIYCAVCSILIIISLNKGTAETSLIEGEGLDRGIHRIYNPYLIPYYLSLYIFSKTLANMLLTIIQDKDIRNRPGRIGRYYFAIKATHS